MIKKIKKCLALNLSLITLSSFMGSFNIHATDKDCTRPAKLVCSSASEMSLTGLTSEDLKEELVQRALNIYQKLKKELTFVAGESKNVGHYSLISEGFNKDVEYTEKYKKGNCRMISHRFIFEFLKEFHKTGESINIRPLVIQFKNENSHIAVTLITPKEVYIIDLSLDLQNESEHAIPLPVPYIFTAQKYMKYMELTCSDNPPVFFKIITDDVSTCSKKIDKCFSLPLEFMCEGHDKNSCETELPVVQKYVVPALRKGIKNIAFSFLTGRDIISGKKDDSLETISYEDLVKTPLLSKILPPELKEKMLNGTSRYIDYYNVSESLLKKGKRLSDEDADKFITEYLRNIDKINK